MRFNTRRKFLQGIGAAATGAVAGCSSNRSNTDNGGADGNGKNNGSGDADGSDSSQNFSTEIAVSTWPAAPFGLTIRVAQEQGFFQNHNVSIEDIVSFGSGGDSVRGVTTGGLGIGMTAFNAAINAYDAGAPVQIVGNNTARSIIDWVVSPDSEIGGIQDTAGATIAVGNSGSGSEALIYLMYDQVEGVSLDDIEIMNTGGMTDSQTILEEGEADVAYSSPPLTQMQVESGNLRKAWSTNDYIEQFTENIFIAGSTVLEDNPELIEGLLASAIEAHEFIKSNPSDAAVIWANDADFYNEEQAQTAVDYFLNELGEDYFDIRLQEEVVKAPAQALQIMGEREEKPPWEDIINQSALPEDKQMDWVK